MKKLLIIITCIATLSLGGCSLPDWRLVHRIDVQQGNVITQDVINQLKPGMTRRQVQFIAGSPMLTDAFHQDRWDYIYALQPGEGERETEHVTLFFEDDALARISGTLHPQDNTGADEQARKQATLVVPPKERVPPGILSRLWHWVTFRKPDEFQP